MLSKVQRFLRDRPKVTLSAEERARIRRARQTVLKKIESGDTVYGINTGFGKLSQVRIDRSDLAALQVNLLRSHACGVGKAVPEDIVILMMYLKIYNLAAGYSGCSLEVVEKLAELLNKHIYPVIPEQGSVGASGDLAPLAHMALPLIGEGEVVYQGEQYHARSLVEQGLWQPVTLGAKDGLSLINGTQYSTALLTYALLQVKDLVLLSEAAAAMSVEAILATDVPFRPEIQRIRRQRGQQLAALHIRCFLENSEIVQSHKNCDKVQDPYSFRCTAQVVGVVHDVLAFVEQTVENELGAVTDNPLVFADSGEVFSGGNFHAEPIALAADMLTLALCELGNISERRIANLNDPAMSSLPPFLVENSGVNSGFMIAHVTAAALAAENRTLSNPATAQTVSTSANQEDHVSMAPSAGLKLLQVVENIRNIVIIELLTAAQGIDFRRPRKGGRGTEYIYQRLRQKIQHLNRDRIMYEDFQRCSELLEDETIINELRSLLAQGSAHK
jgi:histidine ammonia-lyase